MNKEEKFQQVALFRYSLIASAVTNTYEAPSLAQHFRNIVAKQHRYIDGKYIRVSSSSLERWLYNYRKFGIDGITPKERADVGRTRALPVEAIEQIYALKEKFPHITGKAIYTKLIEYGFIDASETSLATVHRYIRKNNLKSSVLHTNAVKSFEMEFANDCWQADTSYGPVIQLESKKFQTFLISFIDDASRMVMHSQFYLNDNAVNMQDSFKQAIAKFVIPKKLFVDNGRSYDNLQLKLICASLGIVLIHDIPVEILDLHFLHRKECRVTNAATIKISGTEYETPQQYIGDKIKIRYIPTNMSKLFVFSDDNKLLHTIYPVKKIDNSKIKRTTVDYTIGGDF